MRATAEQQYHAGIVLFQVAEELKDRSSDLTDQRAFELAMLANPELAEQYTGFPIRRDGIEEVKNFLENEEADRKYTPKVDQLSKIVEQAPKIPGHPTDWTEVVRFLFQYPDLVEAAAREVMNKLITDRLSAERTYAMTTDESRRNAEVQVRATYFDLSRTVDNPNNLNERALKLILHNVSSLANAVGSVQVVRQLN